MTNYCSWWRNNMAAAPGPTGRVSEHMSDAFLYVNKLRQAKDYQDVLGAHATFVQKKLEMFNDRARQFNDAFAVVGDLVGSFASLSAYRQMSEETARTSPKYKPDDEWTDGERRERTWRAGP